MSTEPRLRPRELLEGSLLPVHPGSGETLVKPKPYSPTDRTRSPQPRFAEGRVDAALQKH